MKLQLGHVSSTLDGSNHQKLQKWVQLKIRFNPYKVIFDPWKVRCFWTFFPCVIVCVLCLLSAINGTLSSCQQSIQNLILKFLLFFKNNFEILKSVTHSHMYVIWIFSQGGDKCGYCSSTAPILVSSVQIIRFVSTGALPWVLGYKNRYKEPAFKLNFIEEALQISDSQYWNTGYTGEKKQFTSCTKGPHKPIQHLRCWAIKQFLN